MIFVEIKVDLLNCLEEEQMSVNNRYFMNKFFDEYIKELKRVIFRWLRSLEGEGCMIFDNYIVFLSVFNDQLNLLVYNYSFNKFDIIGMLNLELSSNVFFIILFIFKKNFVFLCISFIFLFLVFRVIQNLQIFINDQKYFGIMVMLCIYGVMFFICLWVFMFINIMFVKWVIVLGMFSFFIWIGVNFYFKFYIFIFMVFFLGWGQGILWMVEVFYIFKLVFDLLCVIKEVIDKEVFRFNGFFFVGFQMIYIWGNLILLIVIFFFLID